MTAMTTSRSRPARAPQPAVTPREAISGVRKPLGGVKSVGSFLPRLTSKAFEKFGFSTASLIMEWPAIAGRELAACTVPERLKWPRAAGEPGDEGEPVPRRAATLVLRVDAACALDVQYQTRQIIERINAYFGYAAVGEVRLVQAPLGHVQRAIAPPQAVAAPAPLTAEVESVADVGLRQALGRLGAVIRAAR